MSVPKDRLFRHLAMLRLIPRAPRSISTTELLGYLRAEGFVIDMRSLQRDLTGRLSMDFPLQCDESQRPYRWSFAKDSPNFAFPALDTPTALAFVLAQHQLKKVLPHSVFSLLAPHFDLAQRQISGLKNNGLIRWVERVRAIPNGKVLKQADVSVAVWECVSIALLEQKQLEIHYLSRSKREHKVFVLHPAALVSRHSVSYLLGVVDGYCDVRQFALHRIDKANCLDVCSCDPSGFDLDRYISCGGFNNPAPVMPVQLVADVAADVAWLLRETPLATGQKLNQLDGSDWERLSVQVPDDLETLWWVFGLGEKIRVHHPSHWVEKIISRVDDMSCLYERPSTF